MPLLMTIILLAQVATPRPSQAGTITGRLMNSDGKPAATVRVSAIVASEVNKPEPKGTIAASALTDDSGRYHLADVPKGRYHIAAGLLELPTYYPGVSGTKDAIVVSIDAGATVNLDFAMLVPNGFTVSGRLVNRSNQTLGDSLQIILGAPGRSVNINARPDGSFEFVKVLPGSYVLFVSRKVGPPVMAGIRVVDSDVTGVELILNSD